MSNENTAQSQRSQSEFSQSQRSSSQCSPSVPPSASVAGCPLSGHAWRRLTGRGFTKTMLQRAIDWGEVQYIHGGVRVVVGHNEMRAAARRGVDLRECIGIHVVLSWQGTVITAYRNRKLRRFKGCKRCQNRPSR